MCRFLKNYGKSNEHVTSDELGPEQEKIIFKG